MTQKQAKGFTLVELLVVIAIIGLLSTLAIVALGSARSKARDARRISDVKQIQTALELYYADQGTYPVEAVAIELGVPATSDELSDSGFAAIGTGTTLYMGQVPQAITTGGTEEYNYTSADGSTYSITFGLEGSVGGLSGTSGITASPSGIQ